MARWILKKKARLIAKGFNQQEGEGEGVLYQENFG